MEMVWTGPEGMSLTFSTPDGIDGWEGKRRTRVLMEGWRERRGFKRGRLLGVIKMVMVRPWMANLWARSRRGIMCPCAGNGKTKM